MFDGPRKFYWKTPRSVSNYGNPSLSVNFLCISLCSFRNICFDPSSPPVPPYSLSRNEGRYLCILHYSNFCGFVDKTWLFLALLTNAKYGPWPCTPRNWNCYLLTAEQRDARKKKNLIFPIDWEIIRSFSIYFGMMFYFKLRVRVFCNMVSRGFSFGLFR